MDQLPFLAGWDEGAIPRLIAHRGDAKQYPENTFLAIARALQAGACAVEFDVQVTRDGVPVLCHDDTLRRTAGIEGRLQAMTYAQLTDVSVHEGARLGETFAPTPIPTLAEIVTLVQGFPRVTAFVELKQDRVNERGAEPVVDAVLAVLQPVLHQCVVISFDEAMLRAARARQSCVIGWVLPQWNEHVCEQAGALAPAYLFCDQDLLPAAGALWQGPWQWAVYEITSPDTAFSLAQRGVAWIETMAIADMLQHPQLRLRACLPATP